MPSFYSGFGGKHHQEVRDKAAPAPVTGRAPSPPPNCWAHGTHWLLQPQGSHSIPDPLQALQQSWIHRDTKGLCKNSPWHMHGSWGAVKFSSVSLTPAQGKASGTARGMPRTKPAASPACARHLQREQQWRRGNCKEKVRGRSNICCPMKIALIYTTYALAAAAAAQ